MAIAAAAVLAAVAVAAGVFAMVNRGGASSTGESSTTSSGSPASSGSTTSPATDGVATTIPGIQPVVAGWQTMRNTDGNLAYDVPQDWQLKPNGSVSWPKADGSGNLAAARPAFFGENKCKANSSWVEAAIGFRTAGSEDPADAGPQDFADLSESMSVNKDKTTYAKVDNGVTKGVKVSGQPAVLSTGIVHSGTGSESSKCSTATDLRVLSVTADSKTYIVVLASSIDKDKHWVSDADLTKIINSVRITPKN